ncbi:uncharacterized protein LOC119076430 [Bradysia coprophila]|uniref:uncharacterized protein LOC119076430 n=1 Tax=Bradysia coprophila TaxID=38358 RepID=UPI00187DCBB4|nr:uncharacterized protein LOC119076430 [Bradysia coprophila]
MPVLGYRRYSGGVALIGATPNLSQLTAEISAKLVKVQISSSYDSIFGRLCLSSYRNSYDGIKICLQLQLKLTKEGKNERNEIDMFEHFPIETMLTSSGEFRGHQKLDFILNFPKDRIFPHPFYCSSGSLSYKLVALMSQDDKITWETIASKFLLDFKGHYNLSSMEVQPSVDCKEFLDGKITSIFTLSKPVLLVGRDTVLNATLQLEGLFEYQVDVTVTLLRKKQIGEIVDTEIISQQRQQTTVHEHSVVLEWKLDVPLTATVTYANELSPMYSVRYFLKYKASFKQLTGCHGSTFGDGDSIVEVKVATAFDNSSDPSKISEHLKRLTLESRCSSATSILTLPPAYSDLSSSTSAASIPTLPPAYSDLSSCMGSILSLETQPPDYDELDEAETPV